MGRATEKEVSFLQKVAVVIPRYKVQLSLSEKLSLQQAKDVLGRFPIIFMAPQKIRQTLDKAQEAAEYFSDEDFADRFAYSKLLLKPEFYERFTEYEYILIYQLDAFVFSDQLEYFCSLGYDYIGAPMPRYIWPHTGIVGNGGFSLRKIMGCLKITKAKDYIYKISGKKYEFEEAEDKFFGYCGRKADVQFSVPNIKIANSFAVEFNVAHCYDRLSRDNLPFGCHGWSKSHHFTLWKPYISAFCKELSAIEKEIYSHSDMKYGDFLYQRVRWYLFSRMLKCDSERYKMIAEKILPSKHKYVLWGYGIVGKRAHRLMEHLGRSVACIFDRHPCPIHEKGIIVRLPDVAWAKMNNYKIIIATNKFADEMIEELEKVGINGNMYFIYRELERNLILTYYYKVWYKMRQA